MCTKISHLESIEIWKVSPQSFQLPPPLKWPHVKISQKKNLTPRDYLYKHCVSKSATYNEKKYEKCHPKRKNVQNWPIFDPCDLDLGSRSNANYARILLFPRCIYHSNFIKIGLRESGQKVVTDGRTPLGDCISALRRR